MMDSGILSINVAAAAARCCTLGAGSKVDIRIDGNHFGEDLKDSLDLELARM